MAKYWKIILAILFALALALGFFQRQNLAKFSFGSRTTVTHFATQSADTLEGYYQKSLELIRGQNPTTSATFLAVGDINLSRNVAAAIQKSGNPNLPFENMADYLKSADFNFGNLESPFSSTSPIIGGHSLVFGAPADYINSLINYNFKILNLANNHAFDQGLKGLTFTKQYLETLGIRATGVGSSPDEAWAPAVIEQNGIKICFIGASYASINDGGKTENDYVARMDDKKNLKSSILNLKSACDFIIASMHAGTEYTRQPNSAQINFARAAIDAGADMVIGAHPHWVQTIEKYHNKYIFYSLGNFIFDQAFSQDVKEGLALKMTISKQGNCHPEGAPATEGSLTPNNQPALRDSSSSDAFGLGMTNIGTCGDDLQGPRRPAKLESIELIPVIIENSQPRPATEKEAKKILQKINITNPLLKPEI